MIGIKLSLPRMIFIGFLVFFLMGYIEARAGWKLFSSSIEGDLYYDEENISRSSPSILRAQTKEVYSEGKLFWFQVLADVGELPANYEYLGNTVSLIEINCRDNMWRNISVVDYSKKGEVISSSIRSEEWRLIPPTTVPEKIFKEFCRSEK